MPPSPDRGDTAAIERAPGFWQNARARRFWQSNDGRALLFSVLSLIACLSWSALRTVHHPWADLSRGSYTDHFSHMNAARAFTRIGLDIYRKGPLLMYPPVEGEALAKLPIDVQLGGSWTGGIYPMPGARLDKPWVTSWSGYPRFYPPGDLVLFAPVAYLYDQTGLSFTNANRLLIMLLLVYAHIGVFFGTRLVLREATLRTPVLWAAWALLYFEAIHYTLEGFYDFAVAAPLILCLEYLRARRGLAAIVAYCVAAVIHFRVLFLAPLSLYGLYWFVRERQWRGFGRKQWGAVGLIATLSFITLGTFALVTPALRHALPTNAANMWFQPVSTPAVLWFMAVIALGALVLLYARAWLDLALALWLGMAYLSLREAQPWHSLIASIWFIAPVLHVRAGGEEAVRCVRMFLIAYVNFFILKNPIWPNFWMPLLWSPPAPPTPPLVPATPPLL